MTHERGRMRTLHRPITVPVIAGMRHPTRSDEAALAALMRRAYVMEHGFLPPALT